MTTDLAPRRPRLHVAFPVFRSIPVKPGKNGLALHRAFFDQLRLANPTASAGTHARLEEDETGALRIVDAGGKTGTWVNGRRLDPNEAVLLTEGTILRIGSTVMVYREGTTLTDEPSKDALAELGRRGVRHTFIGPFALPALARRLGALLRADEKRRLLWLRGAAGTGTEAIARWIAETFRPGKPYAVFHTAGITQEVAEQTLFGRASGDPAEQTGLLARVAGGTLFCDAITELPPLIQDRLASSPADVLLVAASALSDDELLRAGFSSALRSRLDEAVVTVPTLAERREDLGALTLHFLSLQSAQVDVEAQAIEALALYPWPGNLPELAAVIGEAAGSSGKLTKAALPPKVLASTPPVAGRRA